VVLKVKANLPLQTCWIIRWCAMNCSLIGSEDIEHVCIAMSWCTLGKVVDGVCEEGELVEELLDRRGYGEYAMRWRLLSITSSAAAAFGGLRHDAMRGGAGDDVVKSSRCRSEEAARLLVSDLS
jgi:hypothetical protein